MVAHSNQRGYIMLSAKEYNIKQSIELIEKSAAKLDASHSDWKKTTDLDEKESHKEDAYLAYFVMMTESQSLGKKIYNREGIKKYNWT